MDSTPLQIFQEFLKKATGLPVILEPQPVKLQEPHLRINGPTGIEFRCEGRSDIGGGKIWTADISILLTLEAYGDGPDVFLSRTMEASFKLARLFSELFDFPLAPQGGGSMSVKGERKPGGQIFQNEKSEEGDKPYLFSQSYNVNLYFPYSD